AANRRRRRRRGDLPAPLDPDPLVAATLPATFLPVVAGALPLPVAVDPHPLAIAPVPTALHPNKTWPHRHVLVARWRRLFVDDVRGRLHAHAAVAAHRACRHRECEDEKKVA